MSGELKPNNPGFSAEHYAYAPKQITESTKVYAGSLVHLDDSRRIIPIFDSLKTVQTHAIGGEEIPHWTRRVGGTEFSILKSLLSSAEPEINIGIFARGMFESPAFAESLVSKHVELDLVMPRVRDLGFPKGATTGEIIGTENDKDENNKPAPFTKGRMTELGLDLCPPEVAVKQILADRSLQIGNQYWFAMKPMNAYDGKRKAVFGLQRDNYALWLYDHMADLNDRWFPSLKLAFTFRK